MYFYLKDPKAKNETTIIIQYYVKLEKKLFKYSTGQKINPKYWSVKNKNVIVPKGKDSIKVNKVKTILNRYADYFTRILNYMELNEIPITKDILKEKFDERFKGTKPQQKFIYFTDYGYDFCDRAVLIINRTTKKPYSKNKLKQYIRTLNRINEYQESKKIKISEFTLTEYNKLVLWFTNKGYSTNTIGDSIKNIKVLLKNAEIEGYNIHKDYKESGFSVLREDTVSIALSENEIKRILDFDFSDKPMLENCRDLAIIGFWTGLRINDLLDLPNINKNDKFITVKPKKTKDSSGISVVIPLHKNIKEVLNKRGMPHSISDVNFNKYIKEVCKKVGLNEMVKGSLMNPKTKRKEVGYYEKYKLVSSHTCRRSFATNLYKMNFPTLSIMKITGHSSEKIFLKYIKVTPKEHAEKLLEHWNNYYKD